MLRTVGQLIGFVGTAMIILSFQYKDEKKIYLFQALSGTLFTIHYLLLSSMTGMAMNALSLVRCICLLAGKPWAKSHGMMVSVLTASIALGIITYDGPISILPTVALFVSTVTLWTGNSQIIHLFQLFMFSPLWIVYNTVVGSYSGVFTEILVIVSILLFFYRQHRKDMNSESALSRTNA